MMRPLVVRTLACCLCAAACSGDGHHGNHGNVLDGGFDAGLDASVVPPDASDDFDAAKPDADAMHDAQVGHDASVPHDAGTGAGPSDAGAADAAIGSRDEGADASTDGDAGVQVDASIVPCANIVSIEALPLSVNVGGSLALTAFATNQDIVVHWTGTGGTFSTSSGFSTSYKCTTAGLHSATASYTDDGGCTDSMTIDDVECTVPRN